MLRKKLIEKAATSHRKIRWRNQEIFRIEGFSDAVFAFAVTLLVVSLEVPRTFHDLLDSMRGFVAFAFGFAILVIIWYNQFKFFRRYGLQDAYVIVLNAALLFVVLFFVYPLKFLFSVLVRLFFEGSVEVTLPNGVVTNAIASSEMSVLMIIYGAGYFTIFGIFALLHIHVYRKREHLALDVLEEFDTRSALYEDVINVSIAVFSMLLAAVGGVGMAGWSGLSYMLIGPAMSINGSVRAKMRRKLVAAHKPGE